MPRTVREYARAAISGAVPKFIAEEYAFWAPLAKDAGLKVQ